MRAYRKLLAASLKQFSRDHTSLTVMVLVPLMFVVFFGFAYGGGQPALPGGDGRSLSFVVPGILGMAIMWLGVFAAIPLVGQREQQVLKRFAVTPLPRPTLVAAEVSSRLLVALGQATAVLACARLFSVPVSGNPCVLVALVALGALCFVSTGYAVAALCPTQQAAHGWTQLVTFPMIFLCGVFFPLSAMPRPLQPLVHVLPLTYLADGLRQATAGAGSGLSLGLDAGFLVLWSLACVGVAIRFFRWT